MYYSSVSGNNLTKVAMFNISLLRNKLSSRGGKIFTPTTQNMSLKKKENSLSMDDFVSKLSSLLNNNETIKTLDLFNKEEYSDTIKEALFEVIPILASHLTLENLNNNRDLFICCEKSLKVIAKTCKPSETVLSFLEQMEDQQTDTKFCTLLNLLKISLEQVDPNKSRLIEWCTSTIKSYINCLPISMNQEENVNSARIIDVYKATLLFLEPLLKEIKRHKDFDADIHKNILSILLFMLGSPFCYIQDEHSLMLEEIVKSTLICRKNCLEFLSIIERRSKVQNKTFEKGDLLESEEQVPTLAYANFFLIIFSKDTFSQQVPQVYHPHYIFSNCLHLSNCFLNKTERDLILKGLKLTSCILSRIEKYSLGPEVLELPVHTNFISSVTRIMIYCDSKEERASALQIFRRYIDVLSPRARYFVILHLYKTANHSGLLGLITGIFKTSIDECLKDGSNHDEFLGEKMKILLKHACKLPHGSASDLIEISDEVIAVLNLIRFLAIRDKSNETGFWNCVPEIQQEYLQPLREGIDLARAHWNVKIKDLQEQKKMNKGNQKIVDDVILTIAGEKLPSLPIFEKIEFCYRALNAIDIVESILIRVNECLQNEGK